MAKQRDGKLLNPPHCMNIACLDLAQIDLSDAVTRNLVEFLAAGQHEETNARSDL